MHRSVCMVYICGRAGGCKLVFVCVQAIFFCSSQLFTDTATGKAVNDNIDVRLDLVSVYSGWLALSTEQNVEPISGRIS